MEITEETQITIADAQAAWPQLSWYERWGAFGGYHHETRFKVNIIPTTREISAYAGDVCILKTTPFRDVNEAMRMGFEAWVRHMRQLPAPQFYRS